MERIGAVIVGAGMSTRMEAFKPMLPFEDTTIARQVVEASVDCGVVYCTDAFSAGLDVVDSATAEMCGQVIYPAAVMKDSADPDAAQAFLDYLGGDEAMKVFEAVGFSPVK